MKRSRSGRRSGRRSRSGRSGGNVGAMSALIYGAAREPVATLISPLTSKIPFGNMSDEAALGLAGWFLSKRGGMLGSVGKTAVIVELSRIGSGFLSGNMFSGVSSSSSAAPTTVIG